MVVQVVLSGVRREDTTVYVPALPGCISEGETAEEAMANIREALNCISNLWTTMSSCRKAPRFRNWYCDQSAIGGYVHIVRRLQRAGWTVVRQRGGHIRLQKRFGDELLKLTVPAHTPVKRSTLAHILKQARLSPDEFMALR